MPVAEPFDWDRGLANLASQFDSANLLREAEIRAKIEQEMGEGRSAAHSKEVRSFLRLHEDLIRSAINALLCDLDSTLGTYEYRGDFMALGISADREYSYNASYIPSRPEKAGKVDIFLTVNSYSSGKTITAEVLTLRAPKGEN